MNPATEALRLYALGYHVVPFTARRKLTDHSKPLVNDYIATKPDMSVQVRMGQDFDIAILPTDCCVLDLEMKNGLDGISDLTKLAAQNGMTWEQVTNGCFLTKTKSNGLHVWYRQPSGERLVGGIHILPGIEGKACNGTVHVPPSLGYVASVPIGPSSDLPELPGFIADAWRTCGKKRGEKLDTAISLYPIGQRRQFLLSYAGSLRERSGCSVEELAMMLRHRRDTHCEDPGSMSDEEVFAIAKDIGRKEIRNVEGAALAGDAAAQSVMAIIDNAKKKTKKTEEDDHVPVVIVDTPEEEKAILDPLYAPSWCEPTPMFKMFQDWCRKGAIRFQPETNLLVAASTFGCIMGRTYMGYTGLRSNLYAVAMLRTSMGKDYPRLCGIHLLRQVGRDDSIGASTFGSDAGMIAELSNCPEKLWFADEFADAMKNWRKDNCPAYFDNVRTILKECWNGRDWLGKSLKDRDEAPKIESPHPCLMAFCQPEIFSENCIPEMLASGFLGRFLFHVRNDFVFSTGPGIREDECMPKELKETIAERLKGVSALMRLQNLSGVVRIGIDPDSESAIKKIDYEAEVMACDIMKKKPLLSALICRSREKIIKLAMVHAWTLGRKMVCLDSYKWAKEVSDHGDNSISELMTTSGGSDDHERTVNTIMRKVTEYPGITKSRLFHDHNFEDTKFTRAILTLVNGHKITVVDRKRGVKAYFPYTEEPK